MMRGARSIQVPKAAMAHSTTRSKAAVSISASAAITALTIQKFQATAVLSKPRTQGVANSQAATKAMVQSCQCVFFIGNSPGQ